MDKQNVWTRLLRLCWGTTLNIIWTLGPNSFNVRFSINPPSPIVAVRSEVNFYGRETTRRGAQPTILKTKYQFLKKLSSGEESQGGKPSQLPTSTPIKGSFFLLSLGFVLFLYWLQRLQSSKQPIKLESNHTPVDLNSARSTRLDHHRHEQHAMHTWDGACDKNEANQDLC